LYFRKIRLTISRSLACKLSRCDLSLVKPDLCVEVLVCDAASSIGGESYRLSTLRPLLESQALRRSQSGIARSTRSQNSGL
jgi:hypothetical protein